MREQSYVVCDAFEKYESKGKLPKAVILAHLYGFSSDLDEILRIGHEHNCPVIEDAAESLGTRYRGKCTNAEWKYTGTIGDCGIISFYGSNLRVE